MLKNKQNGFSLIEVLIIVLIAGILLSFSVYSVNLLDKQHQNSTITQLKNQINNVQRKAQMLNFSMRIRHIVEKESQKIAVEYFDVDKRIWLADNHIAAIALSDENINISTPFIDVRANGFISPSTFCIDDDCIEIAQLAQNGASGQAQ